MLAILCAGVVSVTAMADDQSSQSSSSSSDQPSTSTSTPSTSDRTSTLGTSSDNATSVSSPSYGQSSSSRLHSLTPQSFIQDAVIGSLKEVHLGQLAQQKAQNQEVKQFAQRMVQDHSQANQKLMQIAQTKGYSLPATNMFAQLGLGSGSSSGQWSSTDRTSQGAGARDLDRITSGQSTTGGTSTSGQTGTTSGQSSTDTSSTGGTTTPSTSGVDQGSSSSSTSGQTSTSDTSSSATTSSQSSTATTDTPQSSTSSQSAVGGTTTSDQPGTSATTSSSTWQQTSGTSGQLQAHDRQMIQHLQSLSGNEFDRAYIRHMVQGHTKAIEKYEQASRQLQDTEIKNFVTQNLPTLRQHYNQAQQIARTLGVSVQDATSPASGWQRDQINDREGQPRSGSDAGNLNR